MGWGWEEADYGFRGRNVLTLTYTIVTLRTGFADFSDTNHPYTLPFAFCCLVFDQTGLDCKNDYGKNKNNAILSPVFLVEKDNLWSFRDSRSNARHELSQEIGGTREGSLDRKAHNLKLYCKAPGRGIPHKEN